MANFSRASLNIIEWDGLSNLNLDQPYYTEVVVTGNPIVAGTELQLPRTGSTDTQDNIGLDSTIIIRDPNGFFTSTGLPMAQNPLDSKP